MVLHRPVEPAGVIGNWLSSVPTHKKMGAALAITAAAPQGVSNWLGTVYHQLWCKATLISGDTAQVFRVDEGW